MSKLIADESNPRRNASRIQIHEVDENAWKATVYTPGGRMFVIDYAPADEKSGANPDGSPTIAMVREAWRDDRDAFREV